MESVRCFWVLFIPCSSAVTWFDSTRIHQPTPTDRAGAPNMHDMKAARSASTEVEVMEQEDDIAATAIDLRAAGVCECEDCELLAKGTCAAVEAMLRDELRSGQIENAGQARLMMEGVLEAAFGLLIGFRQNAGRTDAQFKLTFLRLASEVFDKRCAPRLAVFRARKCGGMH